MMDASVVSRDSIEENSAMKLVDNVYVFHGNLVFTSTSVNEL